MSDMKCPFCQQDLRTVLDSSFYTCDSCGYTGYKQLWAALIQAKRDLEKSKERCSAWEKKVLDCQMKALALNEKLEIAKSALRQINLRLVIAPEFVAREALEQIEHKEQI